MIAPATTRPVALLPYYPPPPGCVPCMLRRYVAKRRRKLALVTERPKRSHRLMLRLRLHREHPYCGYCGRFLLWGNSSLDHIIPRSRCGSDAASNQRLCCKRCNTLKADLTPREWLELMRFAVALRNVPHAMTGLL